MKFVARQTGLSIHTIRIWEKRYGAVRPTRSPNNRRLYTEEDVARLRLLREATLAGHGIGQIARLPAEQLHRLVREAAPPPSATKKRPPNEQLADAFITRALAAIATFDGAELQRTFDTSAVEFGSPAVLLKVIAPLIEEIGSGWRGGELRIAHEHFATNRLSEFLGAFARPYAEDENAPLLLLATPSGQLHELGAVIAAAVARTGGWRTIYLGAALPSEELAFAVQDLKPRALALSIVYPPDDTALRRDLKKLRALLPANCPLLVGGRSAAGYQSLLRQLGAIHIEQLQDLLPALDDLRRKKATASSRASAKRVAAGRSAAKMKSP